MFILAGFLFMACETVVDIEVPQGDPKLVVFSVLNPDSTVEVVVSRSRFILDDRDFQPVTNAQITMIPSQGESLAFEHREKGIFEANYLPQPGLEYSLKVEATGFESVESRTILPDPVPVESMEVQRDLVVRDQSEYYRLNFNFIDPPGENYYQIFVYTTQYIEVPVWGYQDSFNIFTSRGNIFIEPVDPVFEQENDWGTGLLIEDVTFNGRNYTMQLLVPRYAFESYEGGPEFMEVEVELFHLSPDFYLFERTRRLQDYNEDNPFAEPVPVFNNIENGMGLFSGMSKDLQTLRYVY
jgi:hypothetical protein